MKKFILFAICLFLGNVWMSVSASAADNRQYNCTVNYRYAGKTGKKRQQVSNQIDIVGVNCK